MNDILNNVFLYICDKNGYVKIVVNSINDNQTLNKDERIFDQILPDSEYIWNTHIVDTENESSHKHWKGFLVTLQEETYACYLAILDDNQIMVLGMKNDIQQYLYEEILKINGTLTNRIRKLYKESSTSSVDAYDEISKMNNDLANARRELKKNNLKLEELNSQLEILTVKDFLTDLFNRRYFYSFSHEVASRAKRLKYSCCLIMIDINDFKSINDCYGHDVGDSLLVHLSTCMKITFRNGQDTCFRFGGDEFLVLLESSSYNDSLLAMQRLSKLYEKDSKTTSLAYGIVEISHEDMQEDFAAFIRKADALMYEEKRKMKST